MVLFLFGLEQLTSSSQMAERDSSWAKGVEVVAGKFRILTAERSAFLLFWLITSLATARNEEAKGAYSVSSLLALPGEGEGEAE